MWHLLPTTIALGVDNFFDLGGHSLRTIRLVARLADVTGIEWPIHTIYENPTIEGLAKVLSNRSLHGYDPLVRFFATVGHWSDARQTNCTPMTLALPSNAEEARLKILSSPNTG